MDGEVSYTSVQPPPQGVVPYGTGYPEGNEQMNAEPQPPTYHGAEGTLKDKVYI